MLCVLYAECHILALYAECHNAECRYSECLGTLLQGKNTLAYLSRTSVTSGKKDL